MRRARMAERRKAVGLSQEQVAELLGVDRSTVVRWEAATSTPMPYHRPKLARALKVSVDELTALLADVDVAEGSPPADGADLELAAVRKRLEGLTRSISPDTAGALAENLRCAVANYEQLDHASLAPRLAEQRANIEALLGRYCHPRQREQLFDIAAGTSGLLGYLAVGRGNFPLARAYCAEAFQLAQYAQNRNLQAWVRGMQSFCEYYARNYAQALELALDGLVWAQGGPQSVRLAVNGVARAQGKLGNADGVRRAIDDAYELLDHNGSPTGLPSSITFGCYSAAQVAGNAATAYVAIGEPDRVREYVGLASPDVDKHGSPWSKALVTIDLAVAEVSVKHADLDEACDQVLKALLLSEARPVISVKQRSAEFIQTARKRWGDASQLRVLQNALADPGGSQ